MRDTFDAQSKDSLAVLLDDVGSVVRGLEVGAVAAQRFDLWFTPDEAHHDERMRRGLLGALVDDPAGCALEPYRKTPGVAEFDDCARRIAQHRHALALAAERLRPPAKAARPWVIVLSPGDPERAREEYGLTAPEWPGVYRTSRGTGVVLVALAALPVTRETLALRLLARDGHFLRALRELARLPADAWERRLMRVLVQWRREVTREVLAYPDEEVDIMGALAELNAWYEQYEARLRGEGMREGMREGQLAVLARQFERKLHRPLTDAERETLRGRLGARGDALGDVVLDLEAPALAAWLAAPDAA